MGDEKWTKKMGGPVKQSRTKTNIALFKLSGHHFQRYIVHPDLKTSTGLISEILGASIAQLKKSYFNYLLLKFVG